MPLSGSRSMLELRSVDPEEQEEEYNFQRSQSGHLAQDSTDDIPAPALPLMEMITPPPDVSKDQVKDPQELSSTYYQCRSGRDAAFMDRAIETSTRSTLGVMVGGETSRIGALDRENDIVKRCFVGSRVLKGNQVANQNICLSFDPAILACLTCKKEHSVILGSKPVCILVSDQNFVSGISGCQNCVSVVRMESASLLELSDFVTEIFDQNKFPPGSVICVGSVSHLHNVGLTIYARDWQHCVDNLTRKIAGVQICPLIPIITDDIPGSVATALVELASWLAKLYEGTALGLLGSWSALAATLSSLTVEDLQAPTYHTVALPVNLTPGSALAPHRFRSTSSRRVTSPGCDAKTTDELLSAVLAALNSDLGIDCLPGGNSARETIAEHSNNDNIKKVILVGSSHMRRVAEPLQEAGYGVRLIQLTGGLPTESAIEAAKIELLSTAIEPGTAVIFDLLGNYTYRYAQADGDMVLPVPLQGGHHLLGDIGVVSDRKLKQLVSNLLPLFGCLSNVPIVIVPSIPRYIKGGCCEEPGHSTNIGKQEYKDKMVAAISHLRKTLRGELTGSNLERYWVPDVIGELCSPAIGKDDPRAVADNLTALFSADNVHLTSLGYIRLARSLADSISSASKKSGTADRIIAGEKKRFFWRGFTSSHGGTRPSHSASGYRHRGHESGGPTRGGGGRQRGGHHPYRGNGGHSGHRGRRF